MRHSTSRINSSLNLLSFIWEWRKRQRNLPIITPLSYEMRVYSHRRRHYISNITGYTNKKFQYVSRWMIFWLLVWFDGTPIPTRSTFHNFLNKNLLVLYNKKKFICKWCYISLLQKIKFPKCFAMGDIFVW